MITHRDRIRKIIRTLFTEHAPAAEGSGPTPAPAIECVLRLRGGAQMQGVLAEVRNDHDDQFDTLKLAMPSMVPHPDHPQNQRLAQKVIAEHFFDYDDVECIVMLRPVDPSLVKTMDRAPLIIT